MTDREKMIEAMARALFDHDEKLNVKVEALTGISLGRTFTWEEHEARWPETAEAFRARADAALTAIEAAGAPERALTDHDLYYLRSIMRNLDQMAEMSAELIEISGYGLGDEVLGDNRNWLDFFITKHAAPSPTSPEGQKP